MSTEIISALIGAVVGALVSAITTALTLRYNYSKLYASTVSANRMDWINVWRKSVSEFLAIAEEINYSGKVSSKEGIRYKVAKNMVLSRLNCTELDHLMMGKMINELDPRAENFASQRDDILELTRQILKPEWERLKKEAKGKKI